MIILHKSEEKEGPWKAATARSAPDILTGPVSKGLLFSQVP